MTVYDPVLVQLTLVPAMRTSWGFDRQASLAGDVCLVAVLVLRHRRVGLLDTGLDLFLGERAPALRRSGHHRQRGRGGDWSRPSCGCR